jgi:hypothetical protein
MSYTTNNMIGSETHKGTVVGTQDFLSGAYSSMLTFICNRIVRVVGWGLSGLTSSSTFSSMQAFADASSSKTNFMVQYFYTRDQMDYLPGGMIVTPNRFSTVKQIFDYINTYSRTVVLEQTMEFMKVD